MTAVLEDSKHSFWKVLPSDLARRCNAQNRPPSPQRWPRVLSHRGMTWTGAVSAGTESQCGQLVTTSRQLITAYVSEHQLQAACPSAEDAACKVLWAESQAFAVEAVLQPRLYSKMRLRPKKPKPMSCKQSCKSRQDQTEHMDPT